MKQNIWHINKSLRLKEYDYNCPGAYFITICISNRRCLFGDVVKEKMVMNKLGEIADAFLVDIPNHFENVEIAAHVVMPNHVHAIVNMYDGDIKRFGKTEDNVGGRYICYLQRKKSQTTKSTKRQYQKLPVIVGTYKAAVTREINKLNPATGFKWQRYYHDHIIRNEKALENIYQYIILNPQRWNEDLENEIYLSNLTVQEREKELKQFYEELTK